MTVMDVGFIGLGKMGRPMASNLLKAGFPVVVHNRSRGIVQELAGEGAHPASSPREVADAAAVIMTALPTPAAVEEVYMDPDGILSGAVSGKLCIDCSTVSPGLSRQLASEAASRGARFLDAPMSGGVAGARNAALTFMVGGDRQAFEDAMPVFQALGKNIHYAGSSGAGSVVKLVNQLLVGIHSAAAVEGMVLGVKGGADPQIILDVISTSFGNSAMLSRNGPAMVERKFDLGTTISLLAKDLDLITGFGREINVRLLLGAIAWQVFEEARALGLSEHDLAGLVLPLEQTAGVKVVRPSRQPEAGSSGA